MTNPLFDTTGNTDKPADQLDVDGATARSLLVGEGKKYKSDEDAAKALLHAQQHIARLEAERQADRAALTERKNAEDLLALIETKLKATSNELPPVVNERVPGNTPAMNTLSKEDIEALLETSLAKRTQVSTEEGNLNKVIDTLASNWGPAFQADLAAKASEMGVSKEYLLDLAKKSPNVFLSAVGGNTKKGNITDVLPARSSTNSTSTYTSNNTGLRNKAYYDALRAKDSRAYWSTNTQVQMHKDALALKEKFFS